MLTLIVPPDAPPQLLKNFLRHQAGLSLTAWRKLKSGGKITVNTYPAEPASIVHPGDSITLFWKVECSITPMPIPLEICYEDEYLLVVNKPAGLLVHPTVKEHANTLANGVLYYFQQQRLPLAFHPVHRLDKNTSGLILIAKLAHIQGLLSNDSVKNLKRIYKAVVTGSPFPAVGTISAPIGRHPDSIIQRIVTAGGQPATTSYRTLAAYRNASLLQVELLTGRTHQIRVHLAHIGHPLLGDDLYGGSRQLLERQALHASNLSFRHPVTRSAIQLSCPLPPDMEMLLTFLKRE